MGELFSYSLCSSLLLTAMYLTYKWILAGENQHGYNRAILWMIYILSLLLPAVLPAMRTLFTAAEPINTASPAVEAGIPVVTFVDIPAPPLVPRILLGVYLAGMAAALLYTALTTTKLLKTISSGEKRQLGLFTLVLLPGTAISPFSWLRYIVMSHADYRLNGEVIVTHETRHLRSRHWIDLMAAQSVAIFQWYNPAAWLMREELRTVHEYQADEAVIDSGSDPKSYQMLLIRKAVGARFPSLANSLNHSKLKMRITMMYQKKSSKARRLRALALIPAGALALLVTNLPAVADALDRTSEAQLALTDSKVTENAAERQTDLMAEAAVTHDATAGNLYAALDNADETLRIIGVSTIKKGEGDDAAGKAGTETGGTDETQYFINGKKTSEAEVKALNANKIESITVKRNPDIIDVSLKKDNRYFVDGKEVSEAEAKSIPSNAIAAVTVKKNGGKNVVEATRKEEAGSVDTRKEVFTVPEQMPQFPGGATALMNFVAENVKYPEAALKANTQGRVIVLFVVSSTGKIVSPEVVRGVSPEIDAEALRVVRSMPDFTPGTFKGKPVDCQYALPIAFKLSGDSSADK